MTERPILFSAPMVRAILGGKKTQTRRIVKTRKCPDFGCELAPGEIAGDEHPERLCPYGQPGDRLWVRETWNQFDGWASYSYAADYDGWGIGPDDDPDHVPDHAVRWRPSIHMPRAASRILLEVTGVRVERLQAISRGDAMAEGCPFPNMAAGPDPSDWYRELWNEINGPDSWAANPWVWVVEFKRAA